MIPAQRLTGLVNTLAQSKHVALVCHRKPDGDAIGATLGLLGLLDDRNVTATPVCQDSLPHHYRFLAGAERFTTAIPEATDLVVVLDCGNDHLTGWSTEELKAVAPIVEIDHHPKPSRPTSPRLAAYDPRASSTAEMIADMAEAFDWTLRSPVATALLTGIITDTNGFQNTNTTAHTMQVAARLLRSGARLKTIIKECFYSSTVPKLKLWGTAMSRIEQNNDSGVVSTVITQEDLDSCGATQEDVEGLVNFLNSIPNVPALMLLTDLRTGEIKGSLRTRDADVDVAKLAGALGGGGHTKAAGFTIPGRLEGRSDEGWHVVS